MRSLYRTLTRDDLRDALALAAALGVVGASFGALAAAAGFPVGLTLAMSLLVFAGGSQFLMVAIVAGGGGAAAAVAAGLLLNARHLPFGLAMGDAVADRWPARLLGTHVMIDESVAFSRARGSGPRARASYWLCGALFFVLWNVGTVLGVLAGSAVPDPAAFGVDAAFPAGLLALLLPTLRHPDARRVGLGAAVSSLVVSPFLPAGLPVLIGLAGLLLLPASRGISEGESR
ncbi:AzlC family ABC transporter permease [Pseudonocardia asaccharolytica]|uniref:Branched-chain amino acid ABC transporter permease n=1 Tax=Pseudonocardia asaccharolytica DSM 44247 = NBRC 16224 TaxID=1123024 RepID=A0A511D8M0_9PSEU|nr:AzlC family ABC transporter permease [Pseudonocardia asaccharolytica]GEL20957.1 branched-chain amino acid ABC transporter permease [Pseudonocardia asaccharolytica DSM 44247 = NBRC 16224]